MAKGYNQLANLLRQAVIAKQHMVDKLVDKGEEASFNEPLTTLMDKAGDYVPKSYIIADEAGNEIVGVLVDQETVFDATTNDVREGKIFASAIGVKTGEKFIPSYVVREGYTAITPGSSFTIKNLSYLYEFNKLQALLCPYNGSIVGSVAAEKVAINDGVYIAYSTKRLSTVTKDNETQWINLNITNASDKPYVIRYFTYKEVN